MLNNKSLQLNLSEMFIQQIYTGCLAQASYYIESNGEVAVIDPIRETEPYLKLAESRNASIKYIFETHFHADFVSGHLDLAEQTHASIVFGPQAKPSYKATIAAHNQLFKLGNCTIKLLHTPGHTIESSCLLLIDENGNDYAVFTGDTLFVGDVGRPDLMSGSLDKSALASHLFDSINNEILPLKDEVIVYPGHGAGSACGKNLGLEKYSTIGEQKKLNYALQPMSRQSFIEAVTSNLNTPPAYFFKDAGINKSGYDNLQTVLRNNCIALSLKDFQASISKGAIIIDTREARIFSDGFVPGSINIGLKGNFAPWVGALIDMNKEIVFIAEQGMETEVVTRLARIGYENVKGFLGGGFSTWLASGMNFDTIKNVEAEDFYFYYESKEYLPVDFRSYNESKKVHLQHEINIPLEGLFNHIVEFDKDRTYLLFCKGGYRSMIAASILKAKGFNLLINIEGGIDKIKECSPELVFTLN